MIKNIDKFLGNKIYQARLARGLSREQLAMMIDVYQSQIARYEEGTNRVSIGRLILLARALGEKVSYFCEDINLMDDVCHVTTQHQRMCLEMSRNFMKITNVEYQNLIINVIDTLAKNPT